MTLLSNSGISRDREKNPVILRIKVQYGAKTSSTRSQGSVSESSSESSRPGSAPCGAATTSKVTRAPLDAFPGRKGNAPVVMETPEKEHPLCQELMTLIQKGLTPNEVYGTVALVKSMRRNKKHNDENGRH